MDLGTPGKRRGSGLVAFRALLPEIRAAIEAGWTTKAIYERFEDRLGVVKYRQFTNLVNQHLGEICHEVRGKKLLQRVGGGRMTDFSE